MDNPYPKVAIFTDDLTDPELDLIFRVWPSQRFIATRCQQCRRSANLRPSTLEPGWFCSCGYFNAYRKHTIYGGLPDETPDQGPSFARLVAAGWQRPQHPIIDLFLPR